MKEFKKTPAKIYSCKFSHYTNNGVSVYDVCFSIKVNNEEDRVYCGKATGCYTSFVDTFSQGNCIRNSYISFHITDKFRCVINRIE